VLLRLPPLACLPVELAEGSPPPMAYGGLDSEVCN